MSKHKNMVGGGQGVHGGACYIISGSNAAATAAAAKIREMV